MGRNRPLRDGSLRRVEAGLSSAWRSFVPDYVVRTLRSHPGETRVANGERTDAVVLFIDVAGFTPLSEALTGYGPHGTEELTRILNSWFDTMVELVSRHGGSVAEFAGDALTAVFWYGSRRLRVSSGAAISAILRPVSVCQTYSSPSGCVEGATKVWRPVERNSTSLLPSVSFQSQLSARGDTYHQWE